MENEFDTNEMGLSTCISVGGVVIPIPPNATTTEENSQDPNHLKVQCITRKIPYFFVMAYHRPDRPDKTETFKRSAEFKKKRLQEIYPNAIIDINDEITYRTDFVKAWDGIDAKLKEHTNYKLKEVHFFGHSGYDELNFWGVGDVLSHDQAKELKQLPWDKGYAHAAFVLHSCRTAQYEVYNGRDDKSFFNKKCIANTLSTHLGIKVVGQVPGASHNTGSTLDSLKYRNSSLTNKWEIDWFTMNPNIVLWGYAAGETVKERDGHLKEYQEFLIDKGLFGNNKTGWRRHIEQNRQIWPCRVFDSGHELDRIVEKDKFNQADLIYI